MGCIDVPHQQDFNDECFPMVENEISRRHGTYRNDMCVFTASTNSVDGKPKRMHARIMNCSLYSHGECLIDISDRGVMFRHVPFIIQHRRNIPIHG